MTTEKETKTRRERERESESESESERGRERERVRETADNTQSKEEAGGQRDGHERQGLTKG